MSTTVSKRGNHGLSLAPWGFRPQSGRLFENLLSRMFDEGDEGWIGGEISPIVDLSETDKEVDVSMDLPGMKAENIDIQVNQNMLTVKGERKEETEEKGRTFHRVERRSGSFVRTVSLPCEVDEDKVNAEYKDGVLSIKMPKSKKSQAKKIAVKT